MTTLSTQTTLALQSTANNQYATFQYHTLPALAELLNNFGMALPSEHQVQLLKSTLKLLTNKDVFLKAIDALRKELLTIRPQIEKEEDITYSGTTTTFITITFICPTGLSSEILFSFYESGLQYDGHAITAQNGF